MHRRTTLPDFKIHTNRIKLRMEDRRTSVTNTFLRLCDVIKAHGPISRLHNGLNRVGNENAVGTSAYTGAESEIPLRKRRKLSLDQSASKIRALFVTPIFTMGYSHIWRFRRDFHHQHVPRKTLAVSSFFGKRFVVQVTNTVIKLLSSSLEEVQVIQPVPAVRIKRASITEDYVMLETYCGLKLIYQGNHESKTSEQATFSGLEYASKSRSDATEIKTVNEEEDLYNNVQQDLMGT
ncbi:hypothetical protein Pst134EA_032652 [Puccinia striiformis f. sp. tritici]|uniref:uncharacterized protein n=1 Tax=Puccinia striiformis f. sp. tritici TaxID=168172 RepID=UPI002007F6D1|nr:uncharacterized protein Pst134EA_032652 [Puccinia striiformis f. sp. tritici]KAH9443462.1 hypothetical protein Pst134EA_032652 [Puccinia striiformis f. sp. tritici]